jgi:plasmid stabilization system protein ParE
MDVRFHHRVQDDLNEILSKYDEVSDALGDDFLTQLQTGVGRVCENPRFFHFDQSGLRRYNLERFPYHFLYDVQDDTVRIWVVRHDRRNPSFGQRRFPR